MSAERLWGTSHENCPSELVLDRLHAGELSAAEARPVHEHLEGCARCRSRAALRDAGMTAFPALDAEQMIDRIHARVASTDRGAAAAGTSAERAASEGSRPRSRARLAIAISSVAAVGALALAFALPVSRTENALDQITAKGGLRLRVFRERSGRVEETSSGERFSPGDRLRFGVNAPEDFQIMIVGVEEDRGTIFTYYPSDGSKSSRTPMLTADGALAGAIELDDHRGKERIHLIACPKPFSSNDLRPKTEALEVPAECASAVFQMTKD